MAMPSRESRGGNPQWIVPGFFSAEVPMQEQVLHSIFSPSYNKKSESKLNCTKLAEVHQRVETDDRRPNDPKTPAKNLIFAKNLSASTPDFFHTPKGEILASPWNDSQSSGIDNDAFFSPLLCGSVPRTSNRLPSQNLSPLSRISDVTEPSVEEPDNICTHMEEPTNVSTNTLQTISLLNFDYIDTCESVQDLARIIDLLQKQKTCPKLLQAAKLRMKVLSDIVLSPTAPVPIDDSPGKNFTSCTANISRITAGNTTMDSLDQSKSTMNFSLSPNSVLYGIDLVDTPKEVSSFEGRKVDFSMIPTRLQPIVEVHTPLRHSKTQLSRETTQNVQTEQSRAPDQNSFMEKLRELEQAKLEAENTVRSLQRDVDNAGDKTKNLVEVLHEIQQEYQLTRQQLEKERSIRERKNQRALEIEERLKQKVADLTKAAAENEEQTRLKLTAERGLRIKAEESLSQKSRRNEELNRLLHDTRKNLETLTRSQMQFRIDLIKAMGVTDPKKVSFSMVENCNTLFCCCKFLIVATDPGKDGTVKKGCAKRFYRHFVQKDCILESGERVHGEIFQRLRKE